MSFSKNYYSILHLPTPSLPTSSSQELSATALRRAYKLALLAAHPDKQGPASGTAPVSSSEAQQRTVDDVREAYAVLSDPRRKREYDEFAVRNPGILGSDGTNGSDEVMLDSDFVLGLEVLDLSDFDVLDPSFAFSEPPAGAAEVGTAAAKGAGDGGAGDAGGAEEAQMEWTRACRCGAEKGFRILEEELEDAERRGEKEVLVGCEGCSLWVRVGFDVEE